MSHYSYQGQAGQSYAYDQQQAPYSPRHHHQQYNQQQHDAHGYGSPNPNGVSAPPYSAYPVASGMMAAGGPGQGGYPPSPPFNPMHANGHRAGYENGSNNFSHGTTAYGDVPVVAAGHNYQQGGLTYQQTLPSAQPGAGGQDRAQAPQPEGEYPVVMAIDFGMFTDL